MLHVVLAAAAACVWERVAKFVPEEYMGLRAVGCNPNMRLYRYTKGQRFGQYVHAVIGVIRTVPCCC